MVLLWLYYTLFSIVGSLEAAKVTLGVAGIAIAGLKATGATAAIIGTGIAGAIVIAAGGITYVVLKKTKMV